MAAANIPLDLVRNLLEANRNESEEKIFQSYKNHFPTWMAYLSQGLNLLLYGVGTKTEVISEFVDAELKSNGYYYMVVDGYNPAVSADQILRTLADNLNLKLSSGCGVVEMASSLRSQLDSAEEEARVDLTLVLHGADGASLRDANSQEALSQLAAAAHIHLIASVDHVNASLLWNHTQLARFRWLWVDATTYRAYRKELLCSESRILGMSGRCAFGRHSLASLESVWASLTTNSRSIFAELVRACVNGQSGAKMGGVSFWKLYRICHGDFLVSTERALEHQIVEFQDHHLITTKRDTDGNEMYTVVVDKQVVLNFLRQKGYDDIVEDEQTPNDETE